MNKQIKLDNGNILYINKDEGYSGYEVIIGEKDFTNRKVLELSIWDDMAFTAITGDNTDYIEFVFDVNHPLYFCIRKLLGDNELLTIDDDNTNNKLEKYMIIKKEKEVYKFCFKNKNKENRFYIFIKNIGPDCRSKIADYSIKFRLVDFFRDVENILLEEFHQITFDEYMETLNYIQDKNLVLKK